MADTMIPKSLELGRGEPYKFFKSQMTKPVFPPKDTSLDGRTVIITGANVGIGLECAASLLRMGLSRLILAVRSPTRGESAKTQLQQNNEKAAIDVWQVDMMSYVSIQAFAARCSALDRIDIVILNAGLVEQKFKQSPEGHEAMLQVNYLSTVLLATLLLPTLKAKAPAGTPGRLTIVNSGASLMAKLPDDTNALLSHFDKEANFGMNQYLVTKALGHIWIYKLVQYVRPEDVVVNLVDPGLVKGTSLHRNTNFIFEAIFATCKQIIGRTMVQGASCYIDAAVVRGSETHGCYLQDWKIFP